MEAMFIFFDVVEFMICSFSCLFGRCAKVPEYLYANSSFKTSRRVREVNTNGDLYICIVPVFELSWYKALSKFL